MKRLIAEHLRKIANSLSGDTRSPHYYKEISKEIKVLVEKGGDHDNLPFLNNQIELIRAYLALDTVEEKEEYVKNLAKLFNIKKIKKIEPVLKKLQKKLREEYDMGDGSEALSTLK